METFVLTMEFDWKGPSNHILVNPAAVDVAMTLFAKDLASSDFLKGHFFLTTSGTSGKIKWVALSKGAILNSAQAVNEHLQVTNKDRWFNPLIPSHVGGLGIIARAYLSKSLVFSSQGVFSKWNPFHFLDEITTHQATLTSLVPTQVYDLVLNSLKAPGCLRAIVVGGGQLNEELYLKARVLGWNLLPSFGMTEAASQIATANLSSLKSFDFPTLKPLPHLSLRQIEGDHLEISGSCLMTGYIEREASGFKVIDPKIDGWLKTEDRAIFSEGMIKSVRRDCKFIKIGGESVDLTRLESVFEEIMLNYNVNFDAALVAREDNRLGHVIQMLTDTDDEDLYKPLVDAFALKVFPFERIRHVEVLSKLPRTALGKLKLVEVH